MRGFGDLLQELLIETSPSANVKAAIKSYALANAYSNWWHDASKGVEIVKEAINEGYNDPNIYRFLGLFQLQTNQTIAVAIKVRTDQTTETTMYQQKTFCIAASCIAAFCYNTAQPTYKKIQKMKVLLCNTFILPEEKILTADLKPKKYGGKPARSLARLTTSLG